jgi:hypothetical protein
VLPEKTTGKQNFDMFLTAKKKKPSIKIKKNPLPCPRLHNTKKDF